MMQRKQCDGYLTVYLAISLTVLLSLFLALIEGVRANGIRAEAECVTEIGMNSILAEYHRELFNQYHLFAIDSSYGTARSGVEDMALHLRGYMERNFGKEDIFLGDFLYKDFFAVELGAIEMTGASILTDASGAVFRRNAAEVIWDDCNLALFQELQQWMRVIEDNGLRERDMASEKQAADAGLQKYNGRKIQISDTEEITVKINNPTAKLEEIRREGILQFVVGDVRGLSDKVLDSEDLLEERIQLSELNQGNMEVAQPEDYEALLERFMFQEYLLKYMGHYTAPKELGVLDYGIEYLLRGNDTDVNNLRETVNILFAIREAANAVYLFGDSEKCTEAEVLALLITSALCIPEAAPALKVVLLLGWSFAESLWDVKMLLSGGEIPLIKDDENWHYDIQSAMQMGDVAGKDASNGLSYEDYLRIFMMFVDLDTLTQRAMNLVEANIRMTPGNRSFRLDNCYEQVEFCIELKSKYGYEYEITRKKGY